MNRRSFVQTASLGVLAATGRTRRRTEKTHILTLSFDDGFRKSFYRIADIYEAFGLRACFNIIASGHLPSFPGVGAYIRPEQMGSFEDWNALQARGHEVMPHGWEHRNLPEQPLDEAKALIDRCLLYFEEHLDGFDRSRAVFNFPFNASTPELETYALSMVRAVRTQGDQPVNPTPTADTPLRLGCWSHGPDNIDNWLEEQVNAFLAGPGGWLVLNTHGLDDEGWGPLSTGYLEGLLARLVSVDHLEMLPTGAVLERG